MKNGKLPKTNSTDNKRLDVEILNLVNNGIDQHIINSLSSQIFKTILSIEEKTKRRINVIQLKGKSNGTIYTVTIKTKKS